jgi:hypothetical protein
MTVRSPISASAASVQGSVVTEEIGGRDDGPTAAVDSR